MGKHQNTLTVSKKIEVETQSYNNGMILLPCNQHIHLTNIIMLFQPLRESNKYTKFILLIIAHFLIPGTLLAQITQKEKTGTTVMPASTNYHKGKFYKFLWGEHYRKDWHQPVSFPNGSLDTLVGGLVPYQTGGGRQSKSLRLRDKDEHEYVLRSIDKSFGKALPEIALGTFLETIANDQVTIAHPYAAMVVAPLAEAAKIYHTNPALYFIPKQAALKQFNDTSGNTLYLFEQRPDENWSTAPNFGNSEKIVSTEKMLEKILKDNDNSVDQKAFVKARLFDMWIGDWGRHEDQWRWATFKDGKKTNYVPIPRDRDNAFTKFDGKLLQMAIKSAHAKHLQTFDYDISNVEKFNFPARNLDRHLLNELNLKDWQDAATELRANLTDAVIDNAVKQIPPEVYPLSGPEIAGKLKSRRDKLNEYANTYFLFINYEVEITGTEDDELFQVKRISSTETQINIFKINNDGDVKEKPYYSRTFNNLETKEVRIYGINGKDQYQISGDVSKSIKLRLIGGPGKDKYVDESKIKKNGRRTIIYDDYDNEIKKSGETQLHLSKDNAVHDYKYDYFKPNKNSYKPILFYTNDDRIYVGYSYLFEKQQWRKYPYGMQHYVDVKYSIAQKAVSSTYTGAFAQLIGSWDLKLFANYDAIRWTNFFGLGNETDKTTNDRDFNRVRSRQFLGKIGIQRVINNKHRINIDPFFQSYDVVNDTSRFLAKTGSLQSNQTYHTQNFGGGEIQYIFQTLNDSILPTKGFSFLAAAVYSHNLKKAGKDLGKYASQAEVFIPLSRKFSLAVKAGGTTLTGTPEFYQYNIVGTTETLRGHQRDRFYGNSTAYNQNELRWITPVRSHLFNGKFGLFGLYDVGRAWLKDETSDMWHTSYGGGFILSPFNRLSVSVSYAISEEDKNLHVRLLKPL